MAKMPPLEQRVYTCKRPECEGAKGAVDSEAFIRTLGNGGRAHIVKHACGKIAKMVPGEVIESSSYDDYTPRSFVQETGFGRGDRVKFPGIDEFLVVTSVKPSKGRYFVEAVNEDRIAWSMESNMVEKA